MLANVARIIQHIATQSTFKETQPHMQPLNTFITKMTPLVMQFLDALAVPLNVSMATHY